MIRDGCYLCLYLVKTEDHNRTFGGFYSKRLKSVSVDNWIRDEKAFIIQLDDRKIFKVQDADKANFYWSSGILHIGNGCDFAIYDNFN